MTTPRDLEGIRNRLSAEQRKLLERRLQGSESATRLPDAIPRLPDAGDALASFAQRRQWFLWKLDPRSAAYHLLGGLRLSGNLDMPALERGLNALIERHGALRTVFRENAAGEIRQIVKDHLRINVSYVEAQRATSEDADYVLLDELRQLRETPFDLEQGPLIRAILIGDGRQTHEMHIALHHAIADHRSLQILLEELAVAYTGEVTGAHAPFAHLPVSYADFSMWQYEHAAGVRQTQQLEWWKKRLTREVPALDLQTDHPRRVGQASECAFYSFDMNPELAKQLRQQSHSRGASLFASLLSAFQALLYRYTGQTQLRIGVPMANRHQPEILQVVGFFVNTVVMQCEIDGRSTVGKLFEQTRDGAREAVENQDVPFDRVVEAVNPERQLGSTPLFQVMFNHLKDEPASQRWAGLVVAPIVTYESHTQFDLALHTREQAEGGIVVSFVYAKALFDPSTVARIAGHYLTLLQALANHPYTRICEVVLPDQKEARSLAAWSRNPADHRPFEPVHQAFEAAAFTHPSREALIVGNTRITYGELDRLANQFAHRLVRAGIKPDMPVGIAAMRSIEMVVGLLAILKAGGGYVPLDPELPDERLEYMIQDSGIAVLLAQPAMVDHLPCAQSVKVIPINLTDLDKEPLQAPAVATHPDQLAYVIYTSGSTGTPKGAANRHCSLWNRLEWMQDAYRLSPDDVVLQKTPFSFDVSVWEFFWPLMTGARLIMAAPGEHRDPTSLTALIKQHGVTTLHFVPSMLQAFLGHEGSVKCTTITRVICSGEALPVETANAVLDAFPAAQLYNLYGPTEAAIDVTHWTCERQASFRIPIGNPISNVTTYVLGDDLQMAPVGVAGELHLGGIGLARGYLNRPALSADRFIADVTGGGGERLYRTGDLVRWTSAGTLEYLGRLDDQVKIRGFRIELGEVEAALLSQPNVREAVAVAKDGPLGLRLVGFVSLHAREGSTTDALRAALARTLPEYMVPSLIVVLENLPLNANGKIDRRALPTPDPGPNRAFEAPISIEEHALADVWSEVLGIEKVGRNDNFFDAGGHSLMALRIIALLAERHGCEIPVRWFFESPTLQSLAARVPKDVLGSGSRQTRLSQIDSIISQIEVRS